VERALPKTEDSRGTLGWQEAEELPMVDPDLGSKTENRRLDKRRKLVVTKVLQGNPGLAGKVAQDGLTQTMIQSEKWMSITKADNHKLGL
jgi:hypothetical protein